MWDAREDRRNAHHEANNSLIQLASIDLQLTLLNDPHGPATWQSNNHYVRPGVLDLV